MLTRALAYKGDNLYYSGIELTGDDTTVRAVGYNNVVAEITFENKYVLQVNDQIYDSCDNAEGVNSLIKSMFWTVSRGAPDHIKARVFAHIVEINPEIEYFYYERDYVLFMFYDGFVCYVSRDNQDDQDNPRVTTHNYADYDGLSQSIRNNHDKMKINWIANPVMPLEAISERTQEALFILHDTYPGAPIYVRAPHEVIDIYCNFISANTMQKIHGEFGKRVLHCQCAMVARKNLLEQLHGAVMQLLPQPIAEEVIEQWRILTA